MNLKDIEKADWVKHWAGGFDLLSCSYFGQNYTQTVKDFLGTCVHSSIITVHKGFSVCHISKEDFAEFGNFLADRVKEDENTASEWCSELKKRTDEIMDVIERLRNRELTFDEFSEFKQELYDYASPHMGVKKVVDYLSPELLKKLLPIFEDARVYSEKVYAEAKKFMEALANVISRKTGMKPELILCCLKEEFTDYLQTGKLPEEAVLKKRNEAAALIFIDGECELVDSENIPALEDALAKTTAKDMIEGMTAHPGKVKGVVRIIHNPEKVFEFNKGDILISPMTRPPFIPLMEKSGAIVTDAGGILCHAAIVAREMKKPCVIGTERATQIFKDGDYVEVDADKGIVRKIS